jgi:hypothetical protein
VAEPEDLNKEPEPSSTLPAPGGGGATLALAMAMAMAMVSTTAARQAKQLGNPSSLVSKAAAAASLSKTGTASSAFAANRYGDARGAARGVVLAQAGLPTEASETNVDKATSGLARPPARDLSGSWLVGGGGGRRLALASRRPATRCAPVLELAGLGDRLLGV